jgi:lipoprotein signal peptidase
MSVRASMPLGHDGYPVTVKGHAMSHDTGVAAGLPVGAGCRGRLRQRLIVLTLVAAVIVLDQAAKWWAWRHASWAEINSGGDLLVGPTVSRWYANPVAGALLDFLDFGVLNIALSTLVRRRRPAVVVVPAALMLGGCASNLLDRLGMHYWTAPGSVRGVVDFISAAGSTYNVADCFIVGATPLLLLAVGLLKWRARNRPSTVRAVPPAARSHPRARASILALAGAAVIVTAVAVGATNYGEVSIAPAHVSAQAT